MNLKKHSTLPCCTPEQVMIKAENLSHMILIKDCCCIIWDALKPLVRKNGKTFVASDLMFWLNYSWQKAGRFAIWCSTSHMIRAQAQTKHISLFKTHLKALRADFLALLHPGDSWFGLPDRLAHKGCHPSWNPCLIFRSLDETGHACKRKREKH